MEIGVWNGKHAFEMIECAKQHHPYFNITYIGFDLFESITDEEIENEYSKQDRYEVTEVLSRLVQTRVNVELHKGYTKDTIPEKAHSGKRLEADFIFIDGGHSLETIQTDWDNLQPFIGKNTVILFDDYWIGRTDAGCKVLIDNLDYLKWDVYLLEPLDVFPDKRIRMVRVVKKKNNWNRATNEQIAKLELQAA